MEAKYTTQGEEPGELEDGEIDGETGVLFGLCGCHQLTVFSEPRATDKHGTIYNWKKFPDFVAPGNVDAFVSSGCMKYCKEYDTTGMPSTIAHQLANFAIQ